MIELNPRNWIIPLQPQLPSPFMIRDVGCVRASVCTIRQLDHTRFSLTQNGNRVSYASLCNKSRICIRIIHCDCLSRLFCRYERALPPGVSRIVLMRCPPEHSVPEHLVQTRSRASETAPSPRSIMCSS